MKISPPVLSSSKKPSLNRVELNTKCSIPFCSKFYPLSRRPLLIILTVRGATAATSDVTAMWSILHMKYTPYERVKDIS